MFSPEELLVFLSVIVSTRLHSPFPCSSEVN
jgi:hypothetical protein